MTLKDHLSADRVALLDTQKKREALGVLVDLVAASPDTGDRDAIDEAIRHRERLMSTGIGHGIAVPHVRLESVTKTTMAVGVCRKGITDYESLDEEPVYIVVMIAAPKGRHEEYIRLLSEVTRVLKSESRRKRIVEAESPEDAIEVFLK